MTGFQEILIVVGIILGIFFIPRMMPKRSVPRQAPPRRVLSGKLRIAVAVSLLHLLFSLALLHPWRGDPVPFVYIGILPPAVGWAAIWVYAGFKGKR